ncbi:MAG TPA: winged helix-turn-helix transcriptional regulator [Candidatus Pelethocola excrementipullorum]|nr:winged helix-turn-helix transcriptional regulator [Candidatus Pelethocola excrementipullorum]
MEKNLNVIRLLSEKRSEELAHFFKVMGDSTRVKILFLISDSEMCVSQIANALGMTEAAISHQFQTLRMNGLVRRQRRGRTICYKLDDHHINAIMALGCEHICEKGRH